MANIKEMVLGSPVTKLTEQSKNILDVFTKTIKDLEKVNKEADEEIAKREELIRKAQAEAADLSHVKEANSNVISKISKIFE